ncbi:unnamed protein product, partial [Ectocarpus sp. 12 AP-2014]
WLSTNSPSLQATWFRHYTRRGEGALHEYCKNTRDGKKAPRSLNLLVFDPKSLSPRPARTKRSAFRDIQVLHSPRISTEVDVVSSTGNTPKLFGISTTKSDKVKGTTGTLIKADT